MGPTLSPETSVFKLQTPGKFPEEYKLHTKRLLPRSSLGESPRDFLLTVQA